jgi:transposase-like protein
MEKLQEQVTLSELSKRYEVHPNLIVQWEKSLIFFDSAARTKRG